MPQPSSHPKNNLKRQVLLIALALVFMTFLVYMPASNCSFVNYDDTRFVTNNTHLQDGLTKETFCWAMSAGWPGVESTADYWRPLSFLSHALDIELFGLEARGHHLMSVGIHAAAAVALFLALQVLTGSVWCSAFVAALFALHPLRVESVAWIAERKDVLSGFFFFASIGMYALYARRRFSFGRYLSLVAVFLLTVMSKPMMVTLPCVLILLDFWPLKRLGISAPGKRFKWWKNRVVLEKVPLFLISAVVSLATLLNQNEIGAISGGNEFSWSVRAANAVVSYVVYLVQTVYPSKLVVLYPYTKQEPWRIIGAAVILIGLTTFVILRIRRSPYLATGWLWYLGMLFPVSGLVVQAGGQAHADRYAYIPTVGLYIMAVWMASNFFERWRHKRLILGAAAVLLLIPLGVLAQRQLSHWKDSRALWEHAIRNTAGNFVAHANLGSYLRRQGKTEKAIAHYHEALRIKPDYAAAHNHLGAALGRKGKTTVAIAHFRQALQSRPDYGPAHNNMGAALLSQGKTEAAIGHFHQALLITPDDAMLHYNLGLALQEQEEIETAIGHFQQALRIKPDLEEAHSHIGNLRIRQNNFGSAIEHYEQALRINPDLPAVKTTLARLLATCSDAAFRDGERAIELARSVYQLTGGGNATVGSVTVLDTLALAYAEAGQYEEATAAARSSLDAAIREGAPTEGIRGRLRLYEAGIPYHDSGRGNAQ